MQHSTVKKEEVEIDLDMQELKIDITFETETRSCGLHMGIQCCNFIKEQIGRFPDGLIETQVLLIKKLIAIKDLNSPYRGKCYLMNSHVRWPQFLWSCFTINRLPQLRSYAAAWRRICLLMG